MTREHIPISALQHWRICPRQCALIHLAGVWTENRLTAEGRALHDRVHRQEDESRAGVRRVTGLTLVSDTLGLIGQADVVEFREGAPPFPVEYKRGRPKNDGSDALQLCAQALCLEEMLGTAIPAGALFYGTIRRRKEISFDAGLRQQVTDTAAAIRAMLESETLPPVRECPHCTGCSLREYCRCAPPVANYLTEILSE